MKYYILIELEKFEKYNLQDFYFPNRFNRM